MTELALVVLMQYVVSTKAGLVNHVEGPTNVKAEESVPAGVPVKTGSGGLAEILLNPGSFLRVGESSEVAIENVDLETIAVQVLSGSAVIEAAGVSAKQPITVKTNDATFEIIDAGIYVFENGNVSILQGKVRTGDSKIVFKKGWKVDKGVAWRAVKLTKGNPSRVEAWSQDRSATMAAMNAQVMTSYRPADLFGHGIWLYSTALGAYTFLPNRPYHSPYGQTYYPAGGFNRSFDRESSAFGAAEMPRSPAGSSVIRGADDSGASPPSSAPAPSEYRLEKNRPSELPLP
jgi:hypothetical protein